MDTRTMTALSYASGPSSTPLLGETIGANLRRTAARFPGHDAVVSVHQDQRLSYAELDALVDRVGTGLMGAGIGRGDRVGIWAPNSLQWLVVQYATARIGAILVNLNPAYRTHEIEYALRQSETKLLCSGTSHKTSDYAAMIEEVRGGLEALQRVVFIDDPADWASLADVEADADALAERDASLGFDDPINIQYTSGTTGAPKGATLTHHNLLNNGHFVCELLDYAETDRVCLPVPFYHCFGMVMGNIGTLSHGACVVIPAPPSSPPRRCAPSPRSGSRRCTACRRCSSRCSPTRRSPRPTWARCAPASWPAHRARWRS